MINKQNLWFITLFSLIMVLSIYYLTMSDDTLSTLNVNSNSTNNNSEVVISENETLVALKVADEEVQKLNKNEITKDTITKKIKDTYKLDSFVSIDGNNIKITIASSKHDTKLANNIIRSVQELFSDTKYITVKFGN